MKISTRYLGVAQISSGYINDRNTAQFLSCDVAVFHRDGKAVFEGRAMFYLSGVIQA